MSRIAKAGLVVVVPMAAVIAAVTRLYLDGHLRVAARVAISGSYAVVLGSLAFIVFVDTKRRWPDASLRSRVAWVCRVPFGRRGVS